MKLPNTNFNPPFNITRASHLIFTARDLGRSREFYTEVLGLIVSDADANTLWLRGVEEIGHHSLTIKRAKGQPVCERLGMRVFTDEDLDKAKAHFDRAGVKSAFVEVPYQGRTLHFNDPAGTPIELVATMERRPRMYTKIHQHKGAGALRMDHYQVLVPDVLANARFYMDLGFRISDYLYVANGILGPTGTPPGIVQALNREFVKLNSSGKIRDTLITASYDPGTISPEQYGAMIDRELAQWGAIVKETGVQVKT